MPFPVDAEATQVQEEARSVLGTMIAQIIGIVRAIINFAIKVGGKVVEWAGEHPLALTLAVANMVIWVS